MQRPITLNMGMRMNGWFDLTSLDKINDREDEDGLRESMRQALRQKFSFSQIKLIDSPSVFPPASVVIRAPSCETYGCRYVDSLIAAEIEGGIPSERIMVGGFSQGATQSKPWVHPSCRESLQSC